MDLEALVRQNRIALRSVAEELVKCNTFTLSTPCAVITDGRVSRSTLTGLRHHVRCSMALGSDAIERFLRLKEAVGFDAAFEAMSADDEVGEEFVATWDAAMGDLARGSVSTLKDVLAMVEQARNGWEATPSKLLVVAVEGKTVQSGLVPVTAIAA